MTLLINIIALCLFLNASLCAEWDPSIICQQYPNSQNRLHENRYADLKERVKEALTTSWCSAEKINLIMDLTLLIRPKVCVEVGVFNGSSILPVATTLRHLNFGKVYAVDAWSNKEAVRNLDDEDPNKAWWSQIDMTDAYHCFKKLIKSWSLQRFCIEVHKSSAEAIAHIPNQIDFLHLDGDYSEIGALQDVELYLPKVKPGGYILLSNFYIMIKREQPKIKAFCALCESCDIIATIEKDNAVLFQKN